MTIRATLRFFGDDVADNLLGAAALGRLLLAWQKALRAVAEGCQVGVAPGEYQPNAAFRRRYELRCSLAPRESGVFELAFGPRQTVLDLGLGDAPAEVFERFVAALAAVAAADRDALDRLLPDAGLRARFLRELQRGLPRSGDAWQLALTLAPGAPVALGAPAHRIIERWIAPTSQAPVTMAVMGELVGLDFERGTFAFRYGPGGRVLSGPYASESELRLLKHRRKPVQVTGLFVLDAADQPIRMLRALGISPVDLAPLVLDRFEQDGDVRVIAPPLALEVALDAAGQAYEVSHTAAGIAAQATTRDELAARALAQVGDHLAAHQAAGGAPTRAARFWVGRLASAPD